MAGHRAEPREGVPLFISIGPPLLKQGRGGQRESRPRGTKVVDAAPEPQGPTHGIMRTAGRSVEPSDQRPGMVDEKIVAHRIDTPMIAGRENDRLVGRGHDPLEPGLVDRRKTRLLPLERDDSDQTRPGQHRPTRQHGLGGSHVEPHGHAAEEHARTPGMARGDDLPQCPVGPAVVGTVACESYRSEKIVRHTAKIALLARTLQNGDNES